MAFCTACTVSVQETLSTEVSITVAQIDNANAIIQEVLDSHYWEYDASNLTFENDVITEKSNTDYEKFLLSSSLSGYDFSGSEGQKSILVTVPLLHSNGNSAGNARFYFVKDTLVEAYYINTFEIPSALTEKNTFTREMDFIEDLTLKKDFSTEDIEIFFDYANAVFDKHSTRAITYSGDTITLLDFANNKFQLVKEHTYSDYIVIAATFIDNSRIAVLIDGNIEHTHLDETDDKTEHNISLILTIYDEKLNPIAVEEMTSNHTALHFANNSLIVTRGQDLEFYEIEGDVISKTGQMLLGHWVSSMETVTINTENALILTNGVDLFLYSIDSSSLLWRTHFPMKSFSGSIYVADLNSDSVPEIYAHDQMGNTIKYYFTSTEIKPQSLDYGYHYLVADFDNDGVSEYIQISLEDNSATLYQPH